MGPPGPLGPLGPLRLPGPLGPSGHTEPPKLPDVTREKDFSGITISYFISKKLQFFNHKNFLILNCLFLGNSLLKSIKHNLIHNL